MATSMDGVKLRKGMEVVEIHTTTHGQHWYLIATEILKTSRKFSLVATSRLGKRLLVHCHAGVDSRIYVDPLKAVA